MESRRVNKDKHRRCRAGTCGDKIALATLVTAAVLTSADPAYAAGIAGLFNLNPDTKTFFFHFVVAGGPIVWVILLPMSVITGCLAVDLAFSIRRKKLLPVSAAAGIAKAAKNPGPADLPEKLKGSADLLSRAVSDAIKRSMQLNDNQQHLSRFAADALQARAMSLLRKVEWCNIIGNVAPMVGLFGTVFGMIKAFNLLGVSGGQPRPDQLAAAISIALITTFWGLLIAIPALAIAGIFNTRIKNIFSEAAIELEALLTKIKLPPAEQQRPVAPGRLEPRQAAKARSVQKLPVTEVSAADKSTKQPMQPNRLQAKPVQTQSAKPGNKKRNQPGPAPYKARGGRRQFPAKPG